ncbi:hypothetical protein JL722_9525 [Aureococcus anophagefferens]|nr:hypothetical protein JL722_9525 [Aureococcus anophagefferens]
MAALGAATTTHNATRCASLDFEKRSVADHEDAAKAVLALDLDGDGDTDVLSASLHDAAVSWFANDGATTFAKRRVSHDAGAGAVAAFAIDVDGDGDVDLPWASHDDGVVAWYENDGAQAFARRVLAEDADGASAVHAVDVDGDGAADVVAAAVNADAVLWFARDDGLAEAVVGASDAVWSLHALDVDGDADADVLAASISYLDDAVAWYENDGAGAFVERAIAPSSQYTQACFGVDVDGDGDVDALAASRLEDAVTWYENDGARSAARVVVAGADGADAVFALDVDGDGDVDVLAASYNDDTVAWHQQVGGRGWRSFTERAVDEAAGGAAGVFAADVDGDGRADILAAAQDDDRVACPLPSPAPTALLTSVTFEEVGTSLAFREAVFALLVSFVSGVGCIVFCTFLPRARAPDADRSAELVEVAATVRGSGDGAGDPKLVIAVPDDRGAPLANVLLVGGDVGDGLPKSALV